MGLRLFFLPNFPGTTFIQGGTFISDSRVGPSGSAGPKALYIHAQTFLYFLPSMLSVYKIGYSTKQSSIKATNSILLGR